MILTTSRKPGRKTRRLAKVLSRFFNWRYVQRGKKSIDDFGGKFIIIQEVKGNPSILKIYDGLEVLSIFFNVGEINKVKMGSEVPIFHGRLPFNIALLKYFNSLSSDEKFSRKVAQSLDSPKNVFVKRENKKIIFELKYNKIDVVRLITRERWIQSNVKIR